jgi:hypothetical protein
MFQLVYEEDWFDDDLVKKMVFDIDKTVVNNFQSSIDYLDQPMNTLDISGGVKCLIMMYKIPNLLINGNHMGDNCAKWIIHLSKMQDCYMALHYGMAFNKDMNSKEEFICTIMNNGHIVKTFSEFYDEYYNFPRDELDRLPERVELPYPLINPYEV